MQTPALVRPYSPSSTTRRLVASAIVLAAALTGCAGTVHNGPDIAPGDVVRVQRRDAPIVQGIVTARDDSVLHVNPSAAPAAGPVAVELQSIRSLELRVPDAHGDEGALIGALGGLAVGVVVAVKQPIFKKGAFLEPSTDDTAGLALVACPIVGAALGAVVGHMFRYERWERVSLDRVGFDVEPTREGARAGALWRF